MVGAKIRKQVWVANDLPGEYFLCVNLSQVFEAFKNF